MYQWMQHVDSNWHAYLSVTLVGCACRVLTVRAGFFWLAFAIVAVTPAFGVVSAFEPAAAFEVTGLAVRGTASAFTSTVEGGRIFTCALGNSVSFRMYVCTSELTGY